MVIKVSWKFVVIWYQRITTIHKKEFQGKQIHHKYYKIWGFLFIFFLLSFTSSKHLGRYPFIHKNSDGFLNGSP